MLPLWICLILQLNLQRDLCVDGQLLLLQISGTKTNMHRTILSRSNMICLPNFVRLKFLCLEGIPKMPPIFNTSLNTSSLLFFCNSPRTASPPSIQIQVSSKHAAHGGGLGRVIWAKTTPLNRKSCEQSSVENEVKNHFWKNLYSRKIYYWGQTQIRCLIPSPFHIFDRGSNLQPRFLY